MKPALMLLLCLLVLTACGQPAGPDLPTFASLPEGDAQRGEALFAESIGGAPTCLSCHSLEDKVLVGPGMAGYGALAGERVAGQSAGEYTLQSILNPSAFVASGFSNVMYDGYGAKLSALQLADLIVYLLSQ